jgi:peptidoglycan/LPS O-acetylase OafA/YrhL
MTETVRPSLPAPAEGGPRSTRFPCFEGLRAVAAMAVVVHHVASFSGADTSTRAGYVFAHLDVGVSIFFLLSGFLLYRPRVLAHLRGDPEPGLGSYLARRAVRIVPAYWVALAFFTVVGTIRMHGAGDVLAYFGFAQIYSRSRALGGIAPAYSLAIEVSFYLFLPVYALVLRRWATIRAEVAGVVGLYLVGIGTHAALLATHVHATPATLWLPAQIDLFAVGMGLAVASAWSTTSGSVPAAFAAAGRHPGWCWAASAAAFLLAATALGLPRTFGDLPKTGEMGRQVLYAATALFLLIPAIFGPQDEGRIRRALRSRPARAVGVVSYGVFLWHFDWLAQLQRWGTISSLGGVRFVALLGLATGLALLSATASWFAVERPLLRRVRGAT